MTSTTVPGTPRRGTGRAVAWLRAGRGGMFFLALLVGVGSGLGAVVFRYLINFFTWLATGYSQFGQQGHVGSAHLPWLGLGFFVVIPVIGGLLYGPLIYNWAREARGHGVPEVMIAVADNGGRIRPQVSAVKALASALCIGTGGSVGREGPIVQIGSALASSIPLTQSSQPVYAPAKQFGDRPVSLMHGVDACRLTQTSSYVGVCRFASRAAQCRARRRPKEYESS